MPILKELSALGASIFRIEGCHYENETLRKVIIAYKKAIENLDECDEIFANLKYDCLGFTLGAMQFN